MGFKHANATAEGAQVTLNPSSPGAKLAGEGHFVLSSYEKDGQVAVLASPTGETHKVAAEDVIPVDVD